MGPRLPFEAGVSEIEADLDGFVAAVFDTLQSSFLVLPRGRGFVDYADFEQAYQVLKRHTRGFSRVDQEEVLAALYEDGLALVVLRSILGMTPAELAAAAAADSGERITQGQARALDRLVRSKRQALACLSAASSQRLAKIVAAACLLINNGPGDSPPGTIHRLDKADTRFGPASLRHVAMEGVPHAMLLYERFLGRPFAAHRDSVSELVGEAMENAVEMQLRRANISYRKTRRAERIPRFEQAPDFIVPDEWNPQVIIEAKIAEDDGTARDKVARIQQLANLRDRHLAGGEPGYEVVACIDGRGFGIRAADMKRLLAATQGKVFTFKTLDRLVDNTTLKRFRSI